MTFPATIYVHTNQAKRPVILNNVDGWIWGSWWECRESYRDTGWEGGLIQPHSSGTAAILTSQSLPVVGDETKAIAPNAWTALKHTAPDHMAHVPPRPKWVMETGLIVYRNESVGGENPGSETLATRQRMPVPVTVSTSLHELTTTVTHYLNWWQLVRILGGTQPEGTRPDLFYRVIPTGTSTFKLLSPNGRLVTFGSAGSGVSLVPAPVQPIHVDLGTAAIHVFRDSLEPRISTSV